ncbi:MAG: hypothetical protein K6G04_01210 [Lachnospiraceae bacterium]|nr:hypothetical protein [Lachnospiraceae bacterium]
MVLGIVVFVLACLVIRLLFSERVLKRKIQELAMQVSLLNQENERIRKRLGQEKKAE